ncbi:MAG TPA: alpha/beta hydrolase [Rhodospirillaceae bacterium]|nr:alpha/beta hydrolase [Rhodospirillaceae bacterium]
MLQEVLRCPAKGQTKDQRQHAPLLFVHGSYCAAWIWAEKYLPYFAERGFSANAVSLRGHGGSEGLLSWASLADFVDDVVKAVAGFKTKPVIIGHSMGGLVVQHYLSKHPAAAAVLMSSVPPSGLGSSIMHMTMFSPDVMWQLGLLQSLGPEAVSAEIIRRAFFTSDASVEEVRHLLPKLQSESHRISAELLAPSQPSPPSGPDRPPVLVLGGDADIFLPNSAFRETATFFGADLEILKGAPHGLMIDPLWWQPSADTIIAWLEKKGL